MDAALAARIQAITSLYSDFDNLPADLLPGSNDSRPKSPLEQVAADLSRSFVSGDAHLIGERAGQQAKPAPASAASAVEQDAALSALHTVRGLLQATQKKSSDTDSVAASTAISAAADAAMPAALAQGGRPRQGTTASPSSASTHMLSSVQRGWLSPSPEKERPGAAPSTSSPLSQYMYSTGAGAGRGAGGGGGGGGSPSRALASPSASSPADSGAADSELLSSLLAQVKAKAAGIEAAYQSMRVSPRLGLGGQQEGEVQGQLPELQARPPQSGSAQRLKVAAPLAKPGAQGSRVQTPTVPPALPPSPLDASAVRGGEGTIPGWASAVSMGASYYPPPQQAWESPVQGTRPRSLSPVGGRRVPPSSPAAALARTLALAHPHTPSGQQEETGTASRAVHFSGVGAAFGGGDGRVEVRHGSARATGSSRPGRQPPTAPTHPHPHAGEGKDQGPLRAQDLQGATLPPTPTTAAAARTSRGREQESLGKAQRLHGLLPVSPASGLGLGFTRTDAAGAESHVSLPAPPAPPAAAAPARSPSPRSPVRRKREDMEGELHSLQAAIEALEGQGVGYTRVGQVVASPGGAAGLLSTVGRRIERQGQVKGQGVGVGLQAGSEAWEEALAERERVELQEAERRRRAVLEDRQAAAATAAGSLPTRKEGPLSTYSLLYEDDEEEVDLGEGEEGRGQAGQGGEGQEGDLTLDENTAFHLDAEAIRRVLLPDPTSDQALPSPYTPARIRALWSPTPLPVPASPSYDGPGRLPSLADQAIQHAWTPLPTGPHEGVPPFHTLDLAMGAGQAGVGGLAAWLEQLAGRQAALRADVRALQSATAAAAAELHPGEVHKYAQASESLLQACVGQAGEGVREAAGHGMTLVGAEWAVTTLARKQQEAAVQGRERIAAIVRRLEQRKIGLHLLQPALEQRLAAKRALLATLQTGLRDVQVVLERCRGVSGRLDAQQSALAREEAAIVAGEGSIGGEAWLGRVAEAAHLAMEQERQAVARRYTALIAQAEEDAEATLAAAHSEGAARAAQLAAAVEGEQGASFDSAMAVLRARVGQAQAQAEGTEARVMALDRQLAEARELRRLKGACRRLWATLPVEQLALALACDEETVAGLRKERAGAAAGGEGERKGKTKAGRVGVSPLVALGLSGPVAAGSGGSGKGQQGEGSPARTPATPAAAATGHNRGNSPTRSPSPSPPDVSKSSTSLAQEALAEARRVRRAAPTHGPGQGQGQVSLQDRLLRTYVPTLRVRTALCAWLANSLQAVPYSGDACTTLFAVACKVGHRQVGLVRGGKPVPPTLTLAAIVGALQGEARVAGERERLARVLSQQEEGSHGPASPSPMHLPFPMSSLLPGTLALPADSLQSLSQAQEHVRPGLDVPTLLPTLASPQGRAGTSPERVQQLLAEAAAGAVRAPMPPLPLPMASLGTAHYPHTGEQGKDEGVLDEADVRAQEAKVEASKLTASLLRSAAGSTVRASLPSLAHATAGGLGAGLHTTLGLAMPYPAYSAQGQEGAAGFVF